MTEWARGNQTEIRGANDDLGGTMRLGAYPCRLIEGTRVRDIYDSELISERHRHRYEVNINLRGQLESAGLLFSGLSPDGALPKSSNCRVIRGSSAFSSTRS